jgi:hypothetical protein
VRFLFSSLNLRKRFENHQDRKFQETWLVIGLAGSAVISLSLVLSYYFPALRFAVDFFPATMLLATVCLGWGYESFSGNAVISRLYIFLATILVVCSAVVSMLIAIPIDRTGFILLIIKVVQQWLGLR